MRACSNDVLPSPTIVLEQKLSRPLSLTRAAYPSEEKLYQQIVSHQLCGLACHNLDYDLMFPKKPANSLSGGSPRKLGV